MPFLSVIIPTYNHDHFLPRSINSVLQQQLADFEVIVVDNSSSDSTRQLIDSYYDHRIKYVSIQNNGIISRSRNLGLKISSGLWVCFLDSDDFWYSDKVSTLMPFMTSLHYDIISSNEYLFNSFSHSTLLLKYGFGDSPTNHSSLLKKGNCLSPSATMISKSFLDKTSVRFSQDPQLIGAEDYDFWLNIAYHHARFFHHQSTGGEYTIHSTNTSSRILTHSLSVLKVKLRHLRLGRYQLFTVTLVVVKHIASTVYRYLTQIFSYSS